LEEEAMKMKPRMLLVAGMAAATLMSAPVFAAKVVISDAALDTVFGAANNSSFVSGISNSTVSGTNANGNIQIGSYQWSDDHSADSSVNKGANDQSGNLSQVQQNATTVANALAWGAVSQSVTTNNADIGHDQKSESWAVMYIGGF
jgi:hypothetical protein